VRSDGHGARVMPARLARSVSLVGLAAVLTRVLGVARDAVLARYFGAGSPMDAFNIATRIPVLLRELFAEGGLSSAFVPALARRLALGNRAEAWRLGSLVLNGLFAVTGVLVVLGIAFAEPLTRLYAGAYAGVPAEVPGFDDKLALTIALTRITMPFLTMIALAAALMAMLNAAGRFFIPAFSPAAYNIVLMVSAIVSAEFGRRLGVEPILGLAAGFVLGGVAQMLIQWPALKREAFRHRWAFDPADRGLREVAMMMGPITVAQAAAQINILVNLWLATGQGTGAVSWLTYASRVMYVPVGVFGVAVATAALPDVARHAARQATDEIRRTMSWSLRLMLMLVVPACFALLALATPVVSLLFEGREFTARDTQAVATALLWYAPGIVGIAAVKIVAPVFYALGDARTPMLVSLGSVATNVILNVALVRVMGYAGLALGASLAATGSAVVLVAMLSRRLGGLDGRRVGSAFGRITLAASVMAAAALGSEAVLRGWLPEPLFLHRLVRVAGAAGFGAAVLVGTAHLLRIEEFRAAVRRITS
jgi:putative peptidoglycan lipid II flippase